MEFDIIKITDAIMVMAGIGSVAGILLAVAWHFFYVKEDPCIESVTDALPGVNCGGCGFPGCSGAARAIVSGKAPVNVCSVGGFDVMQRIAGILDLKTAYDGPVIAVAGCLNGDRLEKKYHYSGIRNCRAEHLLYGGSNGCENGCIGNTSCVRACSFSAIRIGPDRVPEINESKCRGCGKCVAVCPRGVLSLMGLSEKLLYMNRENDCLAPCRQKCPSQVDVPRVIRHIRRKEYDLALLKIKERNPLVLSTGRVCGHPCENICRRNICDQGVAICHLQRFIGEWEISSGIRTPVPCATDTGYRIAVIGGGPAGLSCAYFLRRLGHHPVIFEKKPELGGMLRYGITEYRLPKKVVEWDINGIIELGVTVKTNMTLGKEFSIRDLRSDGYEAVFLGLGAWIIPSLCVDGEYLDGVMSSLEFLSGVGSRIKDLSGAHASVIGESNTAMDCARSCIRLGARSVTVLSPVDQKEMSARKNDVTRAIEEGVDIRFLTTPIRILPDTRGCVSQLEYCHVEAAGDKKGDIGKRVPGSEKKIDATLIISAYERKPDLEYLLHDPKNGTRFKASRKSTLDTDEDTLLASPPNIFAAGDMITGRASVISAVAGGRKAARSIHFLLTRGFMPSSENDQKKINPRSILRDIEISNHIPKVVVDELPVSLRKKSFIEEIQGTISESQALTEARRCLYCGTLCNDR